MTYTRWVSMTENETKYQRHQRSMAASMPSTSRPSWMKPKKLMAWREREERAWTRFDHRDVLDKLSLAAQCLISKFPMMPDLYKNALQATFLNNAHFSPEALYCIKWYPDLAEWKARVNEMGDTSSAAQSATAFTVTWASTDRLCVTEHKSWTEPFNRGIEFHPVDQASFTHELLHWCTHSVFKQHIETAYTRRSPHYNFMKEATTEWLKRYATGDPGSGGYPGEYKEAVQVMARAGISEQELASAYLGGRDVETVSNKLIVTYDDIEREKAAVGRDASRRVTYERALGFFSTQGKIPNGFARPGNSPENTDIMYEFFHKDGLTTDQVRTRTNQAWASGYDNWKIMKGY